MTDLADDVGNLEAGKVAMPRAFSYGVRYVMTRRMQLLWGDTFYSILIFSMGNYKISEGGANDMLLVVYYNW